MSFLHLLLAGIHTRIPNGCLNVVIGHDIIIAKKSSKLISHCTYSPLGSSGGKLPHWTHHSGMNFLGKIEHADIPC